MPGFLRENSGPIVFSVLLHGLIAAALLGTALISVNRSVPKVQPLPIDAVVIDSQVLHAAQRELTERAEQEAARVRAAAEAKAAAEAAAEQAAADARKAEEQRVEEAKQAEALRVSEAQAAAKRAEEMKRAEDAKRAENARKAQEAKRAAEAKQAEEAKRAADQKAKAERETELRKQIADEEHRSAVEASPARAQYIAQLANKIERAWIKPPTARAGLDCVVNITQVPGGEVTTASVSKCNGDEAARRSIVDAVYRASPLPSPPDPALFERNLVIHFHPEE
jgi:colicin import membrane protein